MTSRYRWVILGVGAAGAGAFSALRMGLPALGPALRNAYGLSLPQVGLAFTAVAVGVMLTLVPWGVLTDRIGERPVMTAGLTGTALALAGTAYAPGYELLLAGLLAAGMLGASSTGASGRAVMGWFARSERGLALGIRQMALPLGVGAAMAHDLVAARAAGRDQPRRIVVHRAVDQRRQRQAERIERVQHVPGADTVAVITPRKIENVGLRSAGRQFRTQSLTIREMLQVEREIDREPTASRPGVVGAAAQRDVVIAVVCL